MENKTHPLVSIIIPVYNTDFSQLKTCILSLINQSYKNIEIILVNDGSSNGCEKICEDFSVKDERVSLINKTNSGVSATRNLGLDQAIGNYVMFVDSDDWLERDAVEVAVASIADNEFLVFNYSRDFKDKKKDIVIDKRETLIYNENNQEFNPYDLKVLGSSCAKLYRKDFIGENRFNPNLTNGEDCEFNNRLFLSLTKCKYINYMGYHYIQNENSSVRKVDPNMPDKYKKTILEFKKTMMKETNDNTKSTYYSFVALSYLMLVLNCFFSSKNTVSLSEKIKMHNTLYCDDIYVDLIQNINFVSLPITRKVFILFFKYKLPIVNYVLIKVKEFIK